jgi:hypothetical protein
MVGGNHGAVFLKMSHLSEDGFEIAALCFCLRDHHGELWRLLKTGSMRV